MEPSPQRKVMYGLDASKYPSRLGAPWKDEELIQLLTSVKNKESFQEIAKKHERTLGGIRSKLRQLAAEYYTNDDKSIEEIKVITGLDKESIIDAIQKRAWADSQKEKKAAQNKEIYQVEAQPKETNNVEDYLVKNYPNTSAKDIASNVLLNLDNDRDVILMTLALVVKLHEKVDHLASKIL